MTEFVVTRTSQWDYTVRPCPEAVERDDVPHYSYWRFRTVAEAERANPSMRGKFEKVKGVDGVRSRADPERRWVVDLESLDALLTFVHNHGRVIVNEYWWQNHDLRHIEIYDGYRE